MYILCMYIYIYMCLYIFISTYQYYKPKVFEWFTNFAKGRHLVGMIYSQSWVDGKKTFHQALTMSILRVLITHRIRMYAIYGNIYHQEKPQMLA